MSSLRIAPLSPESMTAEQSELYDAITKGPRGQGKQHFALTDEKQRLQGPFAGFLLSPKVGTTLQALGATLRYQVQLTDRERELAILTVARYQQSDFEWQSHAAIARTLGFSESDLEAIGSEGLEGFESKEQLIGQTVMALLNGDLSDDQWDAAVNTLGERSIFELVTLVGYYSTLALQMRVLRVDS